MLNEEKIKREIIQNFGYAYKAFGLSKIMGHVIALLIFSPKPLSLDEISKTLSRSKGPVSQIMKRLRDRNLIRRVWQPDSRKDYYEIQPDIFENAFRNNFELIKQNTRLARQLQTTMTKEEKKSFSVLIKRLKEMEKFYQIMEIHFEKFLTEWDVQKANTK